MRLQFDALEEAREAHTANISTGGMFVQDKKPRPVGTLLRFELALGDGEPIKGVGEVVWIRTRSQGPDAPSGMGVQFGHLDDANRVRLRAVVKKALDSLGIDVSSEPDPQAVVQRRAPPTEPPPVGARSRSQMEASPLEAVSRRASHQKHRNQRQGARTPVQHKKKAQSSAFAMSPRTTTLLLILGLLALLYLLLT